MIISGTGLPAHVLDEIDALERRVVAADGGRLKLEWTSLRSGTVEHVLVREDGRLVGFLGVYRHGGDPELTGMVDPAYRRRGLATAALRHVLDDLRDVPSVLLVVPRSSVGGRRLALAHGGAPDHSEHALRQRAAAPHTEEPAGLHVRPATEDDRALVDSLMRAGFGDPRGAGRGLDATLVAELAGRPVASLAVNRHGEQAGIFGFVVDPEQRGRGIGRAVLGRVCRELRAGGVGEVHLEVEVANERALRLYTSLGFEPVTTEDYYRLPTSGPS